MSTAAKFQASAVDEVTFGTPVTTTRFFESPGPTVIPQFGRIESQGLRSGTRMLRKDRFVPYRLGAQGDIPQEVKTKGFGFWLKHMLGSVVTSGPNADGRFQHRGALGDLTGKSFTYQDNRPFHPADTNQPFTFFGGKVTKWKLENSVEGLLIATLSCDFADFDDVTALAAVSYPTGDELFSFVGATVTIGGVQFDATNVAIDADSGLKIDRRYLRNSAIKKEQSEQQWRAGTWALSGDFSDMNQLARVKSATAAGAVATIVATWQGPTLIAGSSFPQVVVTLNAARFDEGYPAVNGPNPLSQQLKGKWLDDTAGVPITFDYQTLDATP